MIRHRLFFAALVIAGFVAAQSASASPVVIVNGGQTDSCTITPSSGTVFTLSTTGDVLINGSYTAGTCSTSGPPADTSPTFSPFSPAPADLSVLPNSLGSAGGPVTPAFVAYYANSCTGKVTATAGCPAVPAPWGTGGTVCTGQTNAKNQKYCSPSGTVAIPANGTAASCLYTFQAINCTNGTTSINSQTANVTVQFGTGGSGPPCSPSDPSDIGYTRQCSGSATNYHGAVNWDNTFASLFNGSWPGNVGQSGHSWTVTVNATQYASFQIQTGNVSAGIQLPTNNSGGLTGLMSISTQPGDFVSGSVICAAGTSLSISSKPGSVALCKLAANSTYYMNISMASQFGPPYTTTCLASSCTTSWGFQAYGN